MTYDWIDCPFEMKVTILDDVKQAAQIARALVDKVSVQVQDTRSSGFGLARIKPEGTLMVYYDG